VVDRVVRKEGHRWTAHVVGGPSDGPSSGTGEVGSERMEAQDHIGCPIDLASIRMRRDKGQETVKAGHGGEGGRDLFHGESIGRSEDASVNAAPVIEQVQFLELGGYGWGRKVRPSGGLEGPETIRGGGVDGRRRGRADTVGAKAGKEVRNVARVRQGESFEGAVVVNSEAKKLGGDRVGFGVVEEGESRDEEVKVIAKVVFDSKVINHQRKDDVVGDVTKETGGGSLVEAMGGKMGEKT
jgi:hypothetical protein